MGWTTDSLIARARLYAQEADASSGGVSTANALSLADDELQTYCFPRLLMAHEEYAVVSGDQSITAGTSSYTIPARAYMGRLRDVLFVDTQGNQRSLPLIDPEELGAQFGSAATQQEPSGFYLQAGSVVLWPTPSLTQGTLRLKYTRKPSTLVGTTSCALISSITPAGANYTMAASTGVPSAWAATETTDIADPERPEDLVAVDVSATSINTGTDTWTYVAASVTGVAVGQYTCRDGETCVPPLPAPMLPWLAMRLAAAMLLARDDRAASASLIAKADEMERRLASVLKPRVDGEPKFITTPNGPYRAGWRYSGYRVGRLP